MNRSYKCLHKVTSQVQNKLITSILFVVLISVASTHPAYANEVDAYPPKTAYALETLAGKTMALTINKVESKSLPDTALPKNALIIQRYAKDGTLTFKGYGKNTIDSTGTYTYTKIAPNIALEETRQVSDLLPQPFTYKMVLVFDAPNSGRWHQNFGDGLIYFSGTFNSFTTQ